MKRPEDPIALESLLGADDLAARSERVERGVRAHVRDRAGGPGLGLGHPVLAAAAVILAVVVHLTLGDVETAATGGETEGLEPITVTEETIAEMIPAWLRND